MELVKQSIMATDELRCDVCGVTSGRRGVPFRSKRDLLTHKAHAHRTIIPIKPISKSQKTAHHQSSRETENHVNFCPQCGCNLVVVKAALAFVEGAHGK